MQVVDVWRETDPAAIRSRPGGARDPIVLVERLVQLPYVEAGRLERHDRGRPRGIGMCPHLDPVDLSQAVDQRARELSRTRLDRRAADSVVHYHQVERSYGTFARTFEFADAIDATRATADLADGILTITLPKTAPPPPRRIEVT